jgi:hypothetical protein
MFCVESVCGDGSMGFDVIWQFLVFVNNAGNVMKGRGSNVKLLV